MKYQENRHKNCSLQTIFIPCSDTIINSFNAKFKREEVPINIQRISLMHVQHKFSETKTATQKATKIQVLRQVVDAPCAAKCAEILSIQRYVYNIHITS
jgi:hypothetical protein